MSKISYFPTLEEAIFLHNLLIERYGGSLGIRDLGLLESALARPRSGYYGSLSEQAAALLQSIACNHAFIDGNKRCAFALTAVFLYANGYDLKVKKVSAESFIINKLIKERVDIEEISKWLESKMVRIKQ